MKWIFLTLFFTKLDLENPDGTANLDFEKETQRVNERQQVTGNAELNENKRASEEKDMNVTRV